VFESLKSRIHIFLGVMFAGLVGAGFTGFGAETDSYPLPPSNRETAEKVLSKAIENLGIPEGKGAGILFRTEGTGTGKELLGILAEKFLLNHGYQVHEIGNFPEFRFGIDTLYIKLDTGGKGKKHSVERFAEARVGAFFQETEDMKKVYNGRGVYEDEFPSGMLEHVGRNDTFVIQNNTLFAAAKPFLYGLIMTGLVWLLYSYRG
jgi:hypothetical protein